MIKLIILTALAWSKPTATEQQWREHGFSQGCKYAMIAMLKPAVYDEFAPICKDMVKFIKVDELEFRTNIEKHRNIAEDKK